MMEGPGADSEEKHEPASDIDTAWMDSLKVLDPEGPIREADIGQLRRHRGLNGHRPTGPTGPFRAQLATSRVYLVFTREGQSEFKSCWRALPPPLDAVLPYVADE
jgi:hypothetical protein